ncbi:GGDEF domain-containing protein [Pseudonocardia sp. MH-G8]|nr:GGDEF domain-containing protein [Pseudonocardia sp. MH-G8]
MRRRFAERWSAAVAGTSYVSLKPDELTDYLAGLTDRLVDALAAPRHDPAPAHRIGVELVAAHFTGPETMRRSLTVLGEELPTLVADPLPPDLARRLGSTLGALAAGYAEALCERTLDEQEAIRRAMLAARRESEAKLATSESRLRAMFTEAAIGIGIADLEGNIQEVNPALVRMFGYPAQEFTQRNVSAMVHPDDAPSVWQLYEELVRGRRDHFRVEKRFFRADGAIIWTNLTVSLVRDADGAPAYQVAMLEDVTERQQLQATLAHLAYHDPLTGLPNRALFSTRLAEVFADPVNPRRVGLCSLDLDGFKRVNDSLGHDVGDQLLVAVAGRLAECCGPDRLLARMGGDEFVVLIDGSSGAAELVELAEEIITAMTAPIRLDGRDLSVTTSIGIVEQAVAETTAAELMSAADITLYRAKHDGKGRYAVFDRGRTDQEIARFTLSATLPAAVERGEFVVHYQPLITLADGALRGVEALVRWQHPTFGLLQPDRFIELAEETGAIVTLGRWVLAHACAQARSWRDEFGAAAPFLSVNLAPRQLEEPDLVADVTAILLDTGLQAAQLQLELTEQAVMRDEPGPLKALRALDDLGVGIAVDDFGTGYSNLSALPRLPVRGLKLDGSFVRTLRGGDATDRTDELIVSTLIDLAHGLDLTVTAEGIETADQLERLRSLGCDVGQGWLFAKAVPAEGITAMLRRHEIREDSG